MKKILSFVLITLLLLSFAACKKSAADPTAALYGSWEGQIDLSAYLKERIVLANDELKDTLALSSYPATLTLTFNEDGSYKRAVEGAFDEAAIAALKGELKAGYTAYYTDFLRENEMDMTIAEFEQTTGVSLDRKVEQVADAAYLNSLVKEMDFAGAFLAEEKVLYMASFSEIEKKESGHTFAIDGGKLTLSDATAPTAFEEAFYPLTFEAK